MSELPFLSQYALVGRCPVCRITVFGTSMGRVAYASNEIAELRNEAFILEWVTADAVREEPFGRCEHMKAADKFRKDMGNRSSEYRKHRLEHWSDFWIDLKEREGAVSEQDKAAQREAIANISPGVTAIAVERIRQMQEEGWTSDHDDQWKNGELAIAAACYAVYPERVYKQVNLVEGSGVEFRDPWPWLPKFDKRPSAGDHRRLLVMAGALIAAEIDRIDRERAKQVMTAAAHPDAGETLP